MLDLAGKTFSSRLILGSARYPSLEALRQAIEEAKTEVVTVSLRRETPTKKIGQRFWETIVSTKVQVLPNTAGCYSVKEAVATACLARELFQTDWIKLEVLEDDYLLKPNSSALVEAAGILMADGFSILPYMTEDLAVAERLVSLGCKVLMPWGSPIGSGQGMENRPALEVLRKRFPTLTLVLDAGIGTPSHAAAAMEIGMDAVLVNSAIALAQDPPGMANAFAQAVEAGRKGYLAGLMPKRNFAQASTPQMGIPFWHQKER